jgi:hypothetical protein
MKLASDRLLDQPLTQCLPRLDHTRETLRPPFLDAWLHAMRSDGVDDQGCSRDSGARRAEPAQRIQKAEAFYGEVLEHG